MGQEVKAEFSNSLVVPIPRVLAVNASVSGSLVLPSLLVPSSSRAFQVLEQLLLGRSFDWQYVQICQSPRGSIGLAALV
jgi:hypothetical protein